MVSMDVELMLAIMSTQRHDFVNHLQVISGLIQLHKEERVQEYIDQVVQIYGALSKVGQLKMPEVAAALFAAYHQAAGVQVALQFDVQGDLDGCRVPGARVAQVLEKLVQQSLTGVNFSGYQPELKFSILAVPGGYLCRLDLEKPTSWDQGGAPAIFNWCQGELASYGGSLEWQWSRERVEVVLFLPR